MMNRATAFAVLGLNPSDVIDEKALRIAYRTKALQNHPDKNNSSVATSKMQEVNTAYKLLQSLCGVPPPPSPPSSPPTPSRERAGGGGVPSPPSSVPFDVQTCTYSKFHDKEEAAVGWAKAGGRRKTVCRSCYNWLKEGGNTSGLASFNETSETSWLDPPSTPTPSPECPPPPPPGTPPHGRRSPPPPPPGPPPNAGEPPSGSTPRCSYSVQHGGNPPPAIGRVKTCKNWRLMCEGCYKWYQEEGNKSVLEPFSTTSPPQRTAENRQRQKSKPVRVAGIGLPPRKYN